MSHLERTPFEKDRSSPFHVKKTFLELAVEAAKVEAYGEILDGVKALLEEVPEVRGNGRIDELRDATRDAYLDVLHLIEAAL